MSISAWFTVHVSSSFSSSKLSEFPILLAHSWYFAVEFLVLSWLRCFLVRLWYRLHQKLLSRKQKRLHRSIVYPRQLPQNAIIFNIRRIMTLMTTSLRRRQSGLIFCSFHRCRYLVLSGETQYELIMIITSRSLWHFYALLWPRNISFAKFH